MNKPKVTRALKAAVALYKSFREKHPKKMTVVQFDVPEAVAVMGHVEAIEYKTDHAGKTTLYRHDFVPGSRPLMCVSSDGKQLLLLGGRYRFTGRGIVDHDRQGREVDNPAHGTELD
jgi:hypothetical protein